MMEVFQKWEGSEEKSHVILHYTKKKLEGTSWIHLKGDYKRGGIHFFFFKSVAVILNPFEDF